MSIVAYTYQADVYCPDCIVDVMGFGDSGYDTEKVLDGVAVDREIDRYDEHTFDSGYFPKVVFSYQIEDVEHCGSCNTVL